MRNEHVKISELQLNKLQRKWCTNRWVLRNSGTASSHIVPSSWCLIYKHSACPLVSVYLWLNGINYPPTLTACRHVCCLQHPTLWKTNHVAVWRDEKRGGCLRRKHPRWMQNDDKEGGGAVMSRAASLSEVYRFKSFVEFGSSPSDFLFQFLKKKERKKIVHFLILEPAPRFKWVCDLSRVSMLGSIPPRWQWFGWMEEEWMSF